MHGQISSCNLQGRNIAKQKGYLSTTWWEQTFQSLGKNRCCFIAQTSSTWKTAIPWTLKPYWMVPVGNPFPPPFVQGTQSSKPFVQIFRTLCKTLKSQNKEKKWLDESDCTCSACILVFLLLLLLPPRCFLSFGLSLWKERKRDGIMGSICLPGFSLKKYLGNFVISSWLEKA